MNFDKFKIVDEKVYKREQKLIDKERKALEKEKIKLEKKIESQPTDSLFKKHLQKKNSILDAEYETICKKIDELNVRQQELNSEKKENNKRLFRLLGVFFGALAIIILIGTIVSSFSSKNEEHTTSPVTDDYIVEEYSEDTTITTTTEPEDTLEEITLTPSHEKWSVEIDETDDYISYSVSPYLISDEIEAYELKAQVDNADVLDAEIVIEYSSIHLQLTGKKAGKAIVRITGKNGKVTSDELSVVVREPESETEAETESNKPVEQEYVLNTKTKKIHTPYCSSLSNMKSSNKREVVGTIDEYKAKGYSPCQRCNPN